MDSGTRPASTIRPRIGFRAALSGDLDSSVAWSEVLSGKFEVIEPLASNRRGATAALVKVAPACTRNSRLFLFPVLNFPLPRRSRDLGVVCFTQSGGPGLAALRFGTVLLWDLLALAGEGPFALEGLRLFAHG